VTDRGTVYYGTSSTEYTPTFYCAGGGGVFLNLPASGSIFFSFNDTAIIASGNAPTHPVTPINAAQSSCQV
jgi:hypothetical protein